MKKEMKTTATILGFFAIPLLFSGCADRSVELFDGKTLEGWACTPEEQVFDWKVENGMILGENATQAASILWTTRSFKDFEVELEYLSLSDDYDSGLFLRGESHQVQIGISRSLQQDMTGCIYAPVDEQGSYPGRTEKVTAFHKVGEWNHLKVIVQGNNIQTLLNNEPFVTYQALNIPVEGPVGLQLHQGVHMVVKFRNIRLKELAN
jgi:hypothetical protein